MKKLTHIMLVFALAVTCFFAFPNKGMAEDNTSATAQEIGVNQTINVKYESDTNDYQKWFKFTAPESKMYELEILEPYVDEEDGEGLSFFLVFDIPATPEIDFEGDEGIIFDEGEYPIDWAYVEDDECMMYLDATAGKTYYIVVYNFVDEDSNLDFSVRDHEHVYGKYKDYYGEYNYYCDCGDGVITYIYPRTYTYNGKVKTPKVFMSDTLYGVDYNPKTHYTVKYPSGRKSVGSYKITISFKGELSHFKPITRTFKINPKGTYIRSLRRLSRGFTVKWNRQSGKMATSRITGYKIRYSRYSSMKNARTVTVKGYTNTSKKITKLYKNRTYYVQVRTYKVVKGKTYYSPWSAKKSVKTR